MKESATTPPALTGVHHLKFPVSDLSASLTWFESAFGARRVAAQDHRDQQGRLYAVIVMLPGLTTPVELRLAPTAARALAGYDPVTFGVADRAALEAWAAHLDTVGIAHSPVINGYIGQLLELSTPDGCAVRLYTDPVGGFDRVEMHPDQADIDSAWLNPALMGRPEAY
ncbi:VOC family protein [Kitasatospora sp. NPDC052896]|uniref:VOC family protein n=1 Tax=Kitasatospora sp. NPDC052896 TaxID=3364061 RepID=UPI0037CC71E2